MANHQCHFPYNNGFGQLLWPATVDNNRKCNFCDQYSSNVYWNPWLGLGRHILEKEELRK